MARQLEVAGKSAHHPKLVHRFQINFAKRLTPSTHRELRTGSEILPYTIAFLYRAAFI